MSSTPSILETLMGSAAHRAFLRDYWPRQAFHSWASPESWPTFLKSELWLQFERLDQQYRGQIDVTRGSGGQYAVTGLPLSGAVRDLGLVARLPSVASLFPESADWLTACRNELGIPTGHATLSAFLNPPNLGLGPHCDPGDHLLFHVAGTKKFRWFENPSGRFVSASHATGFPAKPRDAALFGAGFPSWDTLPETASEVILRPGSVLFVPRGTYHETQGGPDGISVSVVMSVNLPTRSELITSYLREYLNQDARWRQPLAEGPDPDPNFGELLTELSEHVMQLQTQRVLAHRAEFGSKRTLTAEDRFLRDPAIRVTATTTEGETRRVDVAGHYKPTRTLRLGEAATRVVEHMADQQRPFSFGELCARFDNWETDSLATLVRTMVREGVVLPLFPERYRDVAERQKSSC